jgi:multiple sugar transport system substrate-binding protein/raffinose/stachyose/melibiose transport system substrate-binding protein
LPCSERVSSATLLAAVFLLLTASGPRAEEIDDLVFLHYWSGSFNGGIDEMATAYNKASPPFRVRTTPFEHEFFKQSIVSMLETGSPPDMFSYWAGAKVQALVDGNHLAPIDRVWSTAGLDKVFPAQVARACTYDGKKYCLPLTQHYVAFFYNKAIFEKHGLTPPDTWAGFRSACETLKEAGVTPIALGTREGWPAQFWFDYLLLRTAGPRYRQRLMTGQASYDDPEVTRAFCQWRQLLEAGWFNETPSQLGWAEAAAMVRSGEAAMTLGGTWIIGLFDGKLGWKQDKDYGFFRFPAMSGDVPMTALGLLDVIVVAHQGRMDKAGRVLDYFSAPGPQMEMSRGSGALSPSLAVPPSFYTPMQRRILKIVRETPHWAFNYDLSTPPEVAELGLDTFKLFVDQPGDVREILPRLATRARQTFARGKP